MSCKRQQLRAIKQLPPCGSCDLSSLQAIISESCAHPTAALNVLPVLLSKKHESSGSSSGGLRGQATLHLPLARADVCVHLPPAVELSATPHGGVDARIQLLGISADWPVSRAPGHFDLQPRVLPARSSVAGFSQRCAALLLAHVLFPDHTQNILGWLAVPVAAADGLAMVAAAVPAAAKHTLQEHSRKVKHRLQRQRQHRQRTGHDENGFLGRPNGVGWVDAAGGVAAGALHALRFLSGPAAILASAGWLWALAHPSSHTLCSCMVALAAVAAEYNQLSTDISKGRVRPGRAAEVTWHKVHKAAAQRLAGFMGDLAPTPPLQPLLKAASCCSIAVGVAVNGQGLCGITPYPASLASAGSKLPSRRSSCMNWLVGADPAGAAKPQLYVTASICPPDSAALDQKLHQSAGLSRSQLLELFTGSTETPLSAAAAAAVKPDQGQSLGSRQLAKITSSSSSSSSSSSTSRATAQEVPLPGRWGSSVTSEGTSTGRAEDIAGGKPSPVSGHDRADRAVVQVMASPSPAASEHPEDDGLQQDHATRHGATHQKGQQGQQGQQGQLGHKEQWLQQQEQHQHQHHCNSNSSQLPIGVTVRTSADAGATAASPVEAAVLNTSGSGQQQADDPLSFLDSLPLYGQQDHVGALAVVEEQKLSWMMRCELALRAVYLLLVFAPFLVLGLPMLMVAMYLLGKATQQEQQQQQKQKQQQQREQQQQQKQHGHQLQVSSLPVNTCGQLPSSCSEPVTALTLPTHEACITSCQGWRRLGHGCLQQGAAGLVWLVQQVLLLLERLVAVVDLLLVLLLGGHWAAGLSAWESAGLFLRRQAWGLLLLSCSWAGAAFIKWAQWSSSRRDIFPEDFCDTLSRLHDRAPTHSFRWTRRLVQQAFGLPLEQLFDSFDSKPLASGSIAQVHRATLRRQRYLHPVGSAVLPTNDSAECIAGGGSAAGDSRADLHEQVVVKVCHPNVAHHIRLDFLLLRGLSAAASRLPMLRGLSIRESVVQFSHTMTAQVDLRVEAVHALRFYNNFLGVRSAICIPRPIPGLVSEQVLVETFEEGRSVARFMKEPSAINTHIVALGVDAFLKMLLADNFYHSDLHPGNILFRQQRLHAEEQQQHQQHQHQQQSNTTAPARGFLGLMPWRRSANCNKSKGSSSSSSSSGCVVGSVQDTPGPVTSQLSPASTPAQWELELQQAASQQHSTWARRHGALNTSTALPAPAAAVAAPESAGGGSHQSDDGAGQAAQLVLLDFGLAEELTPEVRCHFISFLNAISAGDGLSASRHLLSWSHHQTCFDPQAFKRDMMQLFAAEADIYSAAGIDLDLVMKECLRLARKHSVSIDSCYASLVISVCVIVGFAKALDPGVNIMDAATPCLLAYAMTGKVVGRLYS